jgi:8-oxo-dGTP diphosphatase
VGETLVEGVARELLEETGLQVKVLDLIEVFERIFTGEEPPAMSASVSGAADLSPEAAGAGEPARPGVEVLRDVLTDSSSKRPLYHFVILDYLCEASEGTPHPASDVTDVAFASESELPQYRLTPTATRVIQKAFAIANPKR